MPLSIIRNNIVNVKADAIVNSANPEPIYEQGTDLAIYMAAGASQLLEQRKKIGKIERGEAAVTDAFALNAKYIIHTVGPVWEYGAEKEFELLRNCYRNSLELAKSYKCKSIAFPLISTGIYKFPKDEALKIAVSEINEFLLYNDMAVILVVFDEKAFELSGHLFERVEDYLSEQKLSLKDVVENSRSGGNYGGFVRKLFELIEDRGLSNVEVYKKSNIDRKLFSKIQCNENYHPNKNTVLALCIGLELGEEESADLLARADWGFNPDSLTDTIVLWFIRNGEYEISKVNMALFAYHCQTLGM